jgi:hypothetical protein
MVGALDSSNKDLHHYSVSIEGTVARLAMKEAINEVNRQVYQTDGVARKVALAAWRQVLAKLLEDNKWLHGRTLRLQRLQKC